MKRISALIIILLSLVSCRKAQINVDSPVPKYRVNLNINIMIDAPILDTQGGFFVIDEPRRYGDYIGFSGIVIFHGFDDRFYSYDICCPHECKREITVEPSMAGIATCKECGSEYDIGFGSGQPTKAPAQYPMRRYTTTISGYNIHVTN